ncbi:unnamed protein product [Echinostoma caproni]|uniref:Integrase catalytic domain-containing protein n=1 Tax=Echinostoma caproni TaxID=27848 RepID=A0A183B340_9TREM|nr:unnamed protein product [Echinostoma caproni]
MKLMIDKEHASPVSAYQLHEEYQPKWYLPHHAVINSKKPNKIRIVLDCSAKHMGRSLNSMVLQGPDTTTNLVSILLRFRKERIALMADIEEMFMQVKVPEEDRGALRFLWWTGGDVNGQITQFQMLSHPFGATSSLFCSNFALRKTASTFVVFYDRLVATHQGGGLADRVRLISPGSKIAPFGYYSLCGESEEILHSQASRFPDGTRYC